MYICVDKREHVSDTVRMTVGMQTPPPITRNQLLHNVLTLQNVVANASPWRRAWHVGKLAEAQRALEQFDRRNATPKETVSPAVSRFERTRQKGDF